MLALKAPPAPYHIPRYTISLIRETSDYETSIQCITSSEDTFRCLNPFMHNLDREHMVRLCLDTKQGIIGINQVAVGTLNQVMLHPREIFKTAILLNTSTIILAHNHPSGDPTPSREDHTLTERIQEGGQLLGITLLDHLVLGHDRYYSFADHGHLTHSPKY